MKEEVHCEVWMRLRKGDPEFRGMVRIGSRYLYRGDWLNNKQSAAADAETEAQKIHRRKRRRVLH
jgi:hypothetical protein